MFPTEKNPTSGIQVKLQAESLKKQGIEIDIIFLNVRESRLKLNYIKGVWQVFWKTLLNRYDVIHAYFGLSGLSLQKWNTAQRQVLAWLVRTG